MPPPYCRQKVDPKTHQYDQGIYKNLQSVLGANHALWLLPLGPVTSELSVGIVTNGGKREHELAPLTGNSPPAAGDDSELGLAEGGSAV